ncbi:MAG: 2-C-methyl-D-erythritol 4-phosphate cytidylyltransferase [Phycisphaerae bacterium]|nr:2-C-methyl-D-erythritol 4-phosphate cytidylyltransferase [Phycisphaerae bacterium]
MSDLRIGVVIPAAGDSRRFGGDKIGQDLGGRAMLLRTVELFTKRDEVRAIVVAAPPDRIDDFRSRHGAQLSFHGVQIVEGGRIERWETVRNALAAVPEECTHIAVHDAARPAASDDLLSRLFEAAKVLDAVIPGVAVSSTLKRVSDEAVEAEEHDDVADAILGDIAETTRARGRRVTETVPRQGVVAVQTPQVFRAELLRRAYAQGDLSGATDDAQLVERLGEPVFVIEGEARNIKVTTPSDLSLVRAILGVREPEGRPTHKRF